MVDVAKVTESGALEIEALHVVHGEPAAVNLLHSVLDYKVFERLIDVTSRVGGKMELKGVAGLEIFHGLNQALSLLHQTLGYIRWQ